jgi:predicted RecB family nuclease
MDNYVLESELHAVERLPAQARGKSAQFIPIRFVFRNKLGKDDTNLLAFDAFALSKSLGREIERGKIVHGDSHTTLPLNTSSTVGNVRKMTDEIAAMLSRPTPPDHILNRHCVECEYQARCRRKAMDSDDLSLLSSMTANERQKFRDKGIFTVTQLAYTFRPRRRPKWQRDKPERYHHALKALAIRENKTHIVGNPELKIEGTPVYLDIEGLPDRDYYYLIGVRIGNGDAAVQHSLWANCIEEEMNIWHEFINILRTVKSPVVLHYGSYENKFFKKMLMCYGDPGLVADKQEKMTAINLLSLIHGQIYFPTYSNGLKDIGAWLGFEWSEQSLIGANSVACRCDWEQTQDPLLKSRLIAYNTEDCQAAEIVAQAIICLHAPVPGTESTEKSSESDAVYVKSLKRPQRRWGNFISPFKELEEINKTAWWDYQRDRIYVRSHELDQPNRRRNTRGRTSWLKRLPLGKVIIYPDQTSCPFCGNACEATRRRKRTLLDLFFGKTSVKRRIVDYQFNEYWCPLCQSHYGEPPEFWHESHFGRNLVAYVLYEAIELHTPFVTVQKNLSRFFNLNLPEYTLRFIRGMAAKGCKSIYDNILEHLVTGHLLHVDETEVSIRGRPAYVWVFTNLKEVVYLYAAGRDGVFLHDTLQHFKGVLVTDFYGAYDSLGCAQQKCLIHLIRDLNDDVLSHPYDEELKAIVKEFASLLKPIVGTIDERGLKRRFLGKHQAAVNRFYSNLAKMNCQSEAARKCKQRFERNREKLFTFLKHDGIPWNNNNAEHAVKVFAQLRSIVRGSFTEDSVRSYLVLLSISQTCKCSGLDFFDFLRSGEMDIHDFAEGRRRRPTKKSDDGLQATAG